MKRLKDSTIKSYSAKQLAKHLDRLMDLHKSNAPYRIDFAYNKIFENTDPRINPDVLDPCNYSYTYYCDINNNNKLGIKCAILNEYIRWGVIQKPGGTNIDNRILH